VEFFILLKGMILMTNLQRLQLEIQGIELTHEEMQVYLAEWRVQTNRRYDTRRNSTGIGRYPRKLVFN
jgi:hypothetical protein